MLQPINMNVPCSGVGTFKLNTNVTLEMISDLKNIDCYVKKELVKPINNQIITIKECCYKKHYKVDINYVYFDRLMKLNKIMNKDIYKEILDLVEMCEKNQKNWWGVAEDEMVDELTEQINADILKNLMLTERNNGKFDI